MMIGCSAVIAERPPMFTLQDKHVTLKIKRNRAAVDSANKLSYLFECTLQFRMIFACKKVWDIKRLKNVPEKYLHLTFLL